MLHQGGEIAHHRLVVGDQEVMFRFAVEAGALVAGTVDHHCLLSGEAGDLLLPLLLEGGGADHQGAPETEDLAFEQRHGNRLDGLAQPHLVGDDGAGLEQGKAHPFLLVIE